MKRFAFPIFGITLAAPVLAEPAQQQTAIPLQENSQSHADWTGPYIGLQAGAALGGHSATASQDVIPRFDDKSAASFIGGIHIGYDYQLPNNLLIGGIADISYVDYERSAGYNAPGLGEVYRSSFRQNFLGTIRARMGYAFGRLAIYGTGGLAYGDTNSRISSKGITDALNARTGVNNFTAINNSDSDGVGYAVGAGADYLVSNNVTFGVQYLYTNLAMSKASSRFTSPTLGDFSTVTSRASIDLHSVVLKASYRF